MGRRQCRGRRSRATYILVGLRHSPAVAQALRQLHDSRCSDSTASLPDVRSAAPVVFLRDDGLTYTAFLFRDKERALFDVKEWLGKDVIVRNDVLEKMAYRVVIDGSFRRSLVSDDPDLPLLWKKR